MDKQFLFEILRRLDSRVFIGESQRNVLGQVRHANSHKRKPNPWMLLGATQKISKKVFVQFVVRWDRAYINELSKYQ